MPSLLRAASCALMVRLISSSDGIGRGTSMVMASTSTWRAATDSLRMMIWASKPALDALAFSMSLVVSRICESMPYLSCVRASFWLRRSSMPLSISDSILRRASRSSLALSMSPVFSVMILSSSAMASRTESNCICRDSFCLP